MTEVSVETCFANLRVLSFSLKDEHFETLLHYSSFFTHQTAKMADATDCHGNWIFSRPDGIKPFSRYKFRDACYIGHVGYSRERSSDVRHVWRAPWWNANNFPAKSGRVGAIGWNTWSYNDWR